LIDFNDKLTPSEQYFRYEKNVYRKRTLWWTYTRSCFDSYNA